MRPPSVRGPGPSTPPGSPLVAIRSKGGRCATAAAIGLVALLVAIPLPGQEDVPDVLGDESAIVLDRVDLSTGPARVTLVRHGRSFDLLLGGVGGPVTVIEASRLETERTTGSGQPSTVLTFDVVVHDPERRTLQGVGTPFAVGACPVASGSGSAPEPIVLATHRSTGRVEAVVRLGTETRLVSPGDAVGRWRFSALSSLLERTLIVEGNARTELSCREKTVLRETVRLTASGSRPEKRDDETFTITRRLTRESSIRGATSERSTPRIVCVLRSGEAVVLWRGEPIVLAPGESIGPWRLERATVSTRPAGPARVIVEHSLALTELLKNEGRIMRVVDHFRDGRFEGRDDPQSEKRPVTLSAPGGTELPDLGL
jgi:hypothetical protein